MADGLSRAFYRLALWLALWAHIDVPGWDGDDGGGIWAYDAPVRIENLSLLDSAINQQLAAGAESGTDVNTEPPAEDAVEVGDSAADSTTTQTAEPVDDEGGLALPQAPDVNGISFALRTKGDYRLANQQR